MITVHSAWADDFSTLGLCPLRPTAWTVEERAGGVYQLKMTHPMDDEGRWWHLKEWNIIKADAPMRETPRMGMGQSGTVVRKVYKVDVKSRLRLRAKPGTSGKIVSSYKKGTKVVRIGESGDWYEVVVKNGGATGWMHSDYLDYVGEETQNVAGMDTPGGVVEPRQTREQLFRILTVARDDAKQCVDVTAQHVFYDLAGQLIVGKYAPENKPANAAASEMFAKTIKPHAFSLYSDCTAKISGEYTGRNVASALLETDGIVQQAKARLVRDNFDVFVLKDDMRDRGVEIRHGKNMTGAMLTVDVSGTTTTVVPVGSDKEGEPLYLSGDGYIDAPNAADIPRMMAQRIEYDVRVGDGEDEFKTVEKARAELKRLVQLEFDENAINQPTVGLEVNFVALENTREYTAYAHLQAVHLYDVVRVISARSGIDAKLRVTGYVYNGMTKRFDSVTLGELFELDMSVSGYDISAGTISGAKVITGSMSGEKIRDATLRYAKIAQAAIDQLNANAITAIIGRFGEIAAGSVTTDKLYASMAELVTLMVKSINADNITTNELYAALADVILFRAQQINADSIATDKLAAQYAEIVAMLVEQINAENVQADRLGAVLAEFVTMYAGVGEFDFATIQNLVAKALSLEQASAESVYIKNLAVTSANLLSATLGKLVLKGEDGQYYRVFVGSDGSISTEHVELTAGEIQSGQTAGGQQIVETQMNVGDLNATNLQANSAVINQILTTALTADKITAADALIASATIPALYTTSIKAIGDNLDLSANTSIQSIVGDVEGQINASFSEVSQRQDAVEVQMVKKVDGEELRTYLRYSDGTVELGRSGSRYTSQTSDNGFVVLQDGAPMASIVQNTISAPVIEGKRMITIGDFALRLGANGHLILT